MFGKSPDNIPAVRPGKAFIATLIACCGLVAFGMLRQVELTNAQVVAIAMLCIASIVGAFVGELVAARRRIHAKTQARDRKIAKADRAAARALEMASDSASAAPTGTSFVSSIPDPPAQPAPAPAESVDEQEESCTADPAALKFRQLGKGRRANHRKFGRLPLESLTCNLGEVLDLSAGGMKVLATEDGTGPVDVILKHGDGVLAISGAIVWSKRRDAKTWEQGVEFDHLTPEDRRRLTELATNFRKRRTMCA